MPERTGATVDVYLGGVQAQLAHGGHGNHGEGLVDLEQIDLLDGPTGAVHQLADRPDRRGGEQIRRIGVGRVTVDHRLRLQTPALGLGAAHQQQRSGAVGDRTGIGRGHRAALAEGRFEAGNLLRHRLGRLLVVTNLPLLFTLGDLQRDDLLGETPLGYGRLGAAQRFQRVAVLLLAAEAEGVGAFLGESAHQPAFVERIFQAIEEHVVEYPAVAHAVAAAGAVEQVRCVAHAFHAASDNDIGAAGEQLIVGHDHRLHARAAHLVHRGAGGGAGQSGAQCRLPCRCLPLAGR